RDTHRALYAWSRLQRFQTRSHVADADYANHDAPFSLNGMDPVSKFADTIANVVNLRFRGMGTHGNNHGFSIHIGWCYMQVSLYYSSLINTTVNRCITGFRTRRLRLLYSA